MKWDDIQECYWTAMRDRDHPTPSEGGTSTAQATAGIQASNCQTLDFFGIPKGVRVSEQESKCLHGEHEPSDLTWETWAGTISADIWIRVCKHCNCMYPEK